MPLQVQNDKCPYSPRLSLSTPLGGIRFVRAGYFYVDLLIISRHLTQPSRYYTSSFNFAGEVLSRWRFRRRSAKQHFGRLYRVSTTTRYLLYQSRFTEVMREQKWNALIIQFRAYYGLG